MVFTHKLCSGFSICPPGLDLLQWSEVVVHLGHCTCHLPFRVDGVRLYKFVREVKQPELFSRVTLYLCYNSL